VVELCRYLDLTGNIERNER